MYFVLHNSQGILIYFNSFHLKNKGCPICFEGSPTLPPETDVSKILNTYNMTENLKLFVKGTTCESVEKFIFLISKGSCPKKDFGENNDLFYITSIFQDACGCPSRQKETVSTMYHFFVVLEEDDVIHN